VAAPWAGGIDTRVRLIRSIWPWTRSRSALFSHRAKRMPVRSRYRPKLLEQATEMSARGQSRGGIAQQLQIGEEAIAKP
jgi:hypothetical protein